MAQTPRELAPSTSARHYFGARLRTLREQLMWSQTRLSEAVSFSADLIAKIEKAHRWPTSEFAAACDKALGSGAELRDLFPLVDLERRQVRAATAATARTVRAAVQLERQSVASRSAAARSLASIAPAPTGGWATALPGAQLTAPPPAWPVDRLLTLPSGRCVPATTLTITQLGSGPAPATVGGHAASAGLRDLFATELPATDDEPGIAVTTLRQPFQTKVPAAYRLDAITIGIIWAMCGMDDALLTDDAALADSLPQLRRYTELPGSAVGRDVAATLNPVSQMWLGSDFCARFISSRLNTTTEQPLFWTREQYGEEASTWLLFRHKIQYLRSTSDRFGTPTNPTGRVFCVPAAAVAASPVAERVLLLLSAAFMESLNISVHINPDATYATVEGFVLSPQNRVILANWVRADGLWHVDALDRRHDLRRYDDILRGGQAEAITTSHQSTRRLRTLAEYLGLDWSWLTQRCAELAITGVNGMIRPRSRLLTTDGVTAACRYIANLA